MSCGFAGYSQKLERRTRIHRRDRSAITACAALCPGAAVTPQARVRRTDGTTFANVFAAGEIMSGNILSTGYLAGFGLTIGHVWGRIAGAEAARHAHA